MEPLSFASFTLAGILSTFPAQGEQISAANITTQISPAIAGQWEIELEDYSASANNTISKPQATMNLSAANKSQCREVYNFGADNEMWAVSGKEWTYGRYIVSYRDEGLPIIALKTIYDNNEKDCLGNQVDQSDEALIAFLNHEGNRMQWCADPEGLECFMSFNKILP